MSHLGEKGKTKKQFFVTSLLHASRKILELREFNDTARYIFDSCKDLIGATAGYVALLSKNGTENEVLFLDSGGIPCTVDPALPMPIRGLREEAYRTGKTVYENNFTGSEWQKYMPEGHANLENVLFAPLIIEGKASGLLGLANKPSGFTEDDAHIATTFGELAAVALLNSRTMELLKDSEERFQRLSEATFEGVAIHEKGRIIEANQTFAEMFGYEHSEVIGMHALNFVLPDFHELVLQNILSGYEKPYEVICQKKDGSTFTVEVHGKVIPYHGRTVRVTAIRDITDRKKAEEDLLKRHSELSVLHDISSAVSRTIDMDKLLIDVLDTITGLEVLKIEHKGGIFIIEGVRMNLVYHLGHSNEFLNLHNDMRVGDCLCGLCAKTGEIIISNNSHEDSGHTITYPGMTPMDISLSRSSQRIRFWEFYTFMCRLTLR